METASAALLPDASTSIPSPAHTIGDEALEQAHLPVDLPEEKTWVLVMNFKGKKQEVQITESDTVRSFLLSPFDFLAFFPHFPLLDDGT